MNSLQWYDFVRLLVVVLSIWAMYRLGRLCVRHHQRYSPRLKDFLYLVFALMVQMTMGTIENLIKDGPARYTTLLTLVIALVAIRATKNTEDPLIT